MAGAFDPPDAGHRTGAPDTGASQDIWGHAYGAPDLPFLPEAPAAPPVAPAPDATATADATPDAAAAAPRWANAQQVRESMRNRGGSYAHIAAAGSAPAQAPVVQALGQHYVGEDKHAKFRGKTPEEVDGMWSRYADDANTRFVHAHTHYMGEHEQSAHEVGLDQGLLVQGAEQRGITTAAARGVGTQRQSGRGKHIFALSADDQLRAADPWGEHREVSVPGAPDLAELGMINHSSLVAGGAVKAAGELTVEDGVLQQVSDSSGHYLPSNAMTRQALDHFQGGGVDLHDVGVKLTPKNNGEGFMQASAREFMAVQDTLRKQGADDPDQNVVEQVMRRQRVDIQNDLLGALAQRKTRIAGGRMKMTGGAASPEMGAAATAWAGNANSDAAGVAQPMQDAAVSPFTQGLRQQLDARKRRLMSNQMRVSQVNGATGALEHHARPLAVESFLGAQSMVDGVVPEHESMAVQGQESARLRNFARVPLPAAQLDTWRDWKKQSGADVDDDADDDDDDDDDYYDLDSDSDSDSDDDYDDDDLDADDAAAAAPAAPSADDLRYRVSDDPAAQYADVDDLDAGAGPADDEALDPRNPSSYAAPEAMGDLNPNAYAPEDLFDGLY